MAASRTFVIAECGVNHNGSLLEAFRLADASKAAGADAAKFQLFNSEKLWGDGRIAHLELSQDEIRAVAQHCWAIDIEFMCTPFDVESLEFLLTLEVKRLKIASGCLTNNDLLYAAYQSGLPMILSTGMSTKEEIRKAIGTLAANVTLLHCTSAYPCPIEAVNLKAMDDLREFKRPVGYSDHTPGITIALAAVARGAVCLEKHLTLDCEAEGPDHKTSIEPDDFRVMVSGIRTVEESLGDGVKRVQECELELRKAWRD